MAKPRKILDWRVKYHYSGTRSPIVDADGHTTEWINEPGPQTDGVQTAVSEESARAFAKGVVERFGWAEVYYINPESARKLKDWELVAQYPQLGSDGVVCLRCGATAVTVDADYRIVPHKSPWGGACDGERAGVSAEQAESVLSTITKRYGAWLADASYGPTLRDHTHENLRPGSFSIDWDGGPPEWASTVAYGGWDQVTGLRVSPIVAPDHVLVEPINSCTLGVFAKLR